MSETLPDLPQGSTVLDAWQLFANKHPKLLANLPYTRFAINGQYVTEKTVLNDNDEVVFIPPVSGGNHA